MLNKPVRYLHLTPGDALPAVDELRPFKAVIAVEADVPQIWQWDASRWLASSGCLYMMAWGKGCGSWQESVDEAHLEAFNYDEVPADQSIITTSHEEEDLSDTFWFAKHKARHHGHDLRNVLILHISDSEKQKELEEAYANA